MIPDAAITSHKKISKNPKKFFKNCTFVCNFWGAGDRGERRHDLGQEKTAEFARNYLRTMDAQRAARSVGERDGESLLQRAAVRKQVERGRRIGSDVRREDVIRRLAELAFGRANDAIKLACLGGETDALMIDGMELSAVAEFKRNSAGAVEVKLIDRVKALDALYGILSGDDGSAAAALLQALEQPNESGNSDEGDAV